MTAGTRIRLDGSINHSVSEWRVNCEMSITTPRDLHIDHELRQPRAGFVARDFQLCVSGAFDLDGRTVPADVNRLSPRFTAETSAVNPNLEARKEHPARGHLIDQRVQPFGEQQLVVRRFAFDINLHQRRDVARIGNHGGHRDGGLLERLFLRRADSANAYISLVCKVLPIIFRHSRYRYRARKQAAHRFHISDGRNYRAAAQKCSAQKLVAAFADEFAESAPSTLSKP